MAIEPPASSTLPAPIRPGWQVVPGRHAFGFAQDGNWAEVLSTPELSNQDRDIKQALKANGLTGRERNARVAEIRNAEMALQTLLISAEARSELAEALERSIESGLDLPLVRQEGVQLIESRKGPRVTERTSSGSRSGSSGSIRVGGLRSGGYSGSSYSNSRTVSFPADDLLTVVDEGELVVKADRVTFVGRHYTRNATTVSTAAVDGNLRGGTVSFAPMTNTKTWHLRGLSPLAVTAVIFTTSAMDDLLSILRQRSDFGPEVASELRGDSEFDEVVEKLQRSIDQLIGLLPP